MDRRHELPHHWPEAAARALNLPARPTSRWHRGGVGPRTERWLDALSVLLLVTLTAAWGWTFVDARARFAAAGDTITGRAAAVTPATRRITAALTNRDAPAAAYLLDRAVAAFAPERGRSGRLMARIAEPGAPSASAALPSGASLTYAPSDDSSPPNGSALPNSSATVGTRLPPEPGVWRVLLAAGHAIRPITDFSLITLRPLSERRRGKLGAYQVGVWPSERTPRRGYRTPSGLIEVTPENQHTRLSEHFELRDFLTKGQREVWPKYVNIDTRLVDKLELILLDLQERGISTSGVMVMSGFRTPAYNESGGDPTGRAGYSRHMYGDAADIFIDNNGDGRMDDLNGDGRVNLRDAQVMVAAAERVERRHPSLSGGVGLYAATSAHGPFVHIDARGYRARWTIGGGGNTR